MIITESDRGFRFLKHPSYPEEENTRLVSESSAIGDYDDAWDNPGSSYLWIGDNHHLNREEVMELIYNLEHWLYNRRLPFKE